MILSKKFSFLLFILCLTSLQLMGKDKLVGQKIAREAELDKLQTEIISLLDNDFVKCLQKIIILRETALKYGNTTVEISTYNYEGAIYQRQSNYEKALKTYLIGFNKALKSKETKAEISILNNIAVLYARSNEPHKAIIAYQKPLNKLLNRINDTLYKDKKQKYEKIATILLNIGEQYVKLNNHKKALDFFKNAHINAIKSKDSLTIGYVYLGKIQVYHKEKQYHRALKEIVLASNMLENKSDYPFCEVLLNKIEILLLINNPKEASICANKALGISRKIGSMKYEGEVWLLLSQIAEKEDNAKEAFSCYKKYITLKDSVHSIEKEKAFVNLEAKYNHQQQEREILALEKEREEYRIINLISIVIVAIILGLALAIWTSRKKIKHSLYLIQDRNEQISQQKEVIALKSQILESVNKKLNDSIQYAQNLQQSSLPTADDFTSFLRDFAIFMKPKDVVSGDFYFHTSIHNEHNTLSYIAVADCTGHGVPGALMTMTLNTLLYDIIHYKKIHSPAEILQNLSEEVIRSLKQKQSKSKDGADLGVLCFDKKDKKMTFSGSGQNLIYFQNNKMLEINGDRNFIGGINKASTTPYNNYQVSLEQETTFYLFTDGIADQFGSIHRKKFSSKALKKLLSEIVFIPFSEQVKIIENTLETWQKEGNEQQTDDMLLFMGKI